MINNPKKHKQDYCCPVKLKITYFSSPKAFIIDLRASIFKKQAPPNQIMMAPVVVNFPFPQEWRTHLSSDSP